MIQLFVDSQFASPYAMSVFVALEERRIPYSMTTLDLSDRTKDPAGYAALSLTERVPMIIDGDFSLSESSAIVEYLEDAYPGQPLYPKDVRQRARARQIQAWLRSDLLPLRQDRSTEVIFGAPTETPLSGHGKRAASKLFAAASMLLDHDRLNLFDAWSIADLDLALMLNRLVINGDDVPERLRTYATGQWERASVRKWMALPRSIA